jgi:hypothetical protein
MFTVRYELNLYMLCRRKSSRKSQGERKIGRGVPDGRLTPRRTGRLIIGHNVTLNLTRPPLCGSS